jgi:hypothetical protein
MTNDDRSNEDRPADGQAPNWGSAPGASSADAPRYGEQGDTTPRYGERAEPGSAPQYGEQSTTPRYGEHADAPRYGEQADAPRYGEQTAAPQYGSEQYREQQGQYGQSQYGQGQHDDRSGAPAWNGDHQQPYAAAAATNHGGPSWQQYDEPKPAKKKTVGVVAFFLGLIALVLGGIAGYFFGSAIVDSRAFEEIMRNGGTTTPDSSQFSDVMGSPSIIISSVLSLLGTVLGIWAIVQGIIAIVTRRGRGFGVFGLILAVLGPIVLIVVYAVIAGAAAANSGFAP